ncbi:MULTISPECIES: nucleotidyltransferase family protein [Pseudomonas aeruginosa group]|uniref:nucleotidyltransferase family protein n=1 Tax=Pseudomonas aeruginosa group TaxID=136841 RepID=UPI0005BD983E|nr:nucleotidyltransferase family protein [Pseudomonas aeruginosa]AYW41072.1 nucleotidyltransferase family protein [Pseudomonas aeruginosa]
MHADAELKSQAVAGLVLAAGFSRRFGSDKRCARLSSGQTLLAASLALPCAQLEEVWVVLRPEDDSTALGIPPQVQVISCAESQFGMGHSLAIGVQHISRVAMVNAIAVFLGDMPWIGADSLGYLLALASPEHIVVPTFKGRPGHPVLFGRRFWPALQGLSGDTGAKSVIAANQHTVRYLPLNDPSILRDVDTPRSLE